MADSKQAMEDRTKSRSRDTKPTLIRDLPEFTVNTLEFIMLGELVCSDGFSKNDSINARHRETGLTPLMTVILHQRHCRAIMELLRCHDIQVGLTAPSTHAKYPGCNELQILISEILQASSTVWPGGVRRPRFESSTSENDIREVIRRLVEKNKDCLNHIVKDSDVSRVAGQVDQDEPTEQDIAEGDHIAEGGIPGIDDDHHVAAAPVGVVPHRKARLGPFVNGSYLLMGVLKTEYSTEVRQFLTGSAENPETHEARAREGNILSKEMLVKLLVNLGADINQLPPENIQLGMSLSMVRGMPLFHAMRMHDRQMIECSLSLKADPNLIEIGKHHNMISLFFSEFLVRAMLSEEPYAEDEYLEILKLLLKAGAKYYPQGSVVPISSGMTTLGRIQHNFDLTLKIHNGYTASFSKLPPNFFELQSELTLKPNAKIDTCIRYIVALEQFFEIVNRLACDGVKARKEDLERLQYLLDEGIYVNTVNGERDTALHLACRHAPGNAELTRLLLKNGASLAFQNDNKETPLDVAMKVAGVRSIEDLKKRDATYTSRILPILMNFIQTFIDKKVVDIRSRVCAGKEIPIDVLNCIEGFESGQSEMECFAFTAEQKPKSKSKPTEAEGKASADSKGKAEAKGRSEAEAKGKAESEAESETPVETTVKTLGREFIEECVAKAWKSKAVQRIAAKRLMEACLTLEAYDKAKEDAKNRVPQLSLSASPGPVSAASSAVDEAAYKALCISFGPAYQSYKNAKRLEEERLKEGHKSQASAAKDCASKS